MVFFTFDTRGSVVLNKNFTILLLTKLFFCVIESKKLILLFWSMFFLLFFMHSFWRGSYEIGIMQSVAKRYDKKRIVKIDNKTIDKITTYIYSMSMTNHRNHFIHLQNSALLPRFFPPWQNGATAQKQYKTCWKTAKE